MRKVGPCCPMLYLKKFFLIFYYFLYFLGLLPGTWRFPGWGSNWSCSCQPTPEPQHLGIRAMSATYTIAHDNARSLTHWVRPGIKPATSWFLVEFVNHWARTGTPPMLYFRVRNWSLYGCNARSWFVDGIQKWEVGKQTSHLYVPPLGLEE